MAMMTLNSSDAHPKQRIQLRSSIAFAPSAPAALESFDATHMTSSSVKYRGIVSSCSSYSSKAVHWATHHEGGGGFLLDNQCTKTGIPVAEVLWEKHLDMHVPSMENHV